MLFAKTEIIPLNRSCKYTEVILYLEKGGGLISSFQGCMVLKHTLGTFQSGMNTGVVRFRGTPEFIVFPDRPRGQVEETEEIKDQRE